MKTIFCIATSVVLAAFSIVPSEAQEPRAEPNLRVDASASLANAIVRRFVDERECVEDTILDTPVYGHAHTMGDVHAELVPNRSHAAFDVVFRGTTWSQSVGVRPHVYVYTFTTTPLEIRQRVALDVTGIRTFGGPCYAESCTQLLNIESRTWPEDLTIRIARRGFLQSQAAGEAETAAKTAARVSARLSGELTPVLVEAAKTVNREANVYRAIGLKLEYADFSTSKEAMHGRLRLATPGRPQPARGPALPDGADLAIGLHETLANEIAQAELKGRSFQLDEVSKIYAEVTRGLLADARPAGAKKTDLKSLEKSLAKLAGKPVTITFAQKDPLKSIYRDQEIMIEVRTASVRQEKAVYVGPVIRVTYRIENTDKGVLAVRKGAVQILPGEKSKTENMEPLPLQFKLLQEALFEEVFKERYSLNAVALPDAAARLRLDPPRVQSANGWLQISWKLASRAP